MGLFWKRKKDENERPSHWPPPILAPPAPRPQPPAVESAPAPELEAPEAPATTVPTVPTVPTEAPAPPAPPPLRKVDMNFTFGGYIQREPTPEEIEEQQRTF